MALNNKKNLLEGSLYKNMIAFAIPIILSGVLQLLFNAADLIVVGKFDTVNGSLAQAAIGSTGSTVNLIVGIFIGVSAGVNVVIARLVGAKDNEQIKYGVQTAMFISIIAGLVIAVAGYVFAEPLLNVIKTDTEVMPFAITYLRIYFIGAPFSMVYNFGSAILRAYGDTKRPMIYLTIGGIANVILNLIAVIGFNLSVAGVAIATSASGFIACVLVVIRLLKTDDPIKLHLKGFKLHSRYAVQIISTGLPAGIQGSLFSLSNVVIQSAINSFNDPHFTAGNGNAASAENFVYIIMNGFYQAVLTFTGQCCGAKKFDLLDKIYRKSLVLVTIIGLVTSGIFMALSNPIMHLYASSPEDISAGIERIQFMMIWMVIAGLMDNTSGYLRGMGDSFRPMIIALIGVCGFRMVWLYTVFEKFHTPTILYACYPITWTITFVALFILSRSAKMKLINQDKSKKLKTNENNA